MTKSIKTFADFGFDADIMKAVTELGFETPTQIQIESIPVLLKGTTDFLGLASTGTGKTAAFALPLLQDLDPAQKGVQGLILVPTRELAKQVSEQINLLARHKKTKALAIYGGSDYGGQLRALKDGVSIIVGTPGRLIDHLERKTLNLDHLKTVILDEADEMISMGFKEEIEFILQTINQEEKHNTWLFSATMSREVRKIADQFLSDPFQVQVNKTEGVASSVTQYFYQVYEDDKPEVVEKLIDSNPGFYGMIFCQTKQLVVELTQSLKNHGYAVDCIHGDMEQPARERTLKSFKARTVNVIVCTDVASRGIDVKDVTHVVNYSIPRELDLYVHRIGRTGRGGKEGIALSLVSPSHMHLVSRIEKTMRTKMKKAEVPTNAVLLKIKVAKALTDFSTIDDDRIKAAQKMKDLFLETGWREVLDLMSKEEIAARFLAQSMHIPATKERTKPTGGFAERDERGGAGGRRDRYERSPGRYEGREERKPRDHKARGESRPFVPSAAAGSKTKEKGRAPHFKTKPGF